MASDTEFVLRSSDEPALCALIGEFDAFENVAVEELSELPYDSCVVVRIQDAGGAGVVSIAKPRPNSNDVAIATVARPNAWCRSDHVIYKRICVILGRYGEMIT